MIKFGLSEKHTKFEKKSSWFGRLQSKCTKHEEGCAIFCVLLRKSKLYKFGLKDYKIPIFSHFSVSKISQTFLKKFFFEQHKIRGATFIIKVIFFF